MSKYTIEFRRALEYAESFGWKTGLEDYPIFEESYRKRLNSLIIDHYRFREIGYESPEMFFQRLGHIMRLNMPTFNKLYLAIGNVKDALSTFSSVTENSGEASENTSSKSTSSSESGAKSRAVNSAFPQQMLSDDGDYATSATDSVSANTGTANADDVSSNTSSSSGSSTVEGRQGSLSLLIEEYLNSFNNVDLAVIESLETLFMGIWGGADSATPDMVHYSLFGYRYGMRF